MCFRQFAQRSMSLLILLAALSACGGAPTTLAPATVTALPSATMTPSPTPTWRPAPTGTATPSCLSTEGELRQTTYSSLQLDQEVPLWVYLPPCYPLPADQLPVAFFFHGKPFDQRHWLDLGLVQVYEAGLEEGRWQRAIMVIPSLPEPLFSQTDGGAGSYEQEFMEGVLPAVASEHPAIGADRYLAGISRGGIWALEIGLRHPAEFQRVAALSPSLAVNYPRPSFDPFQLALDQPAHPDGMLLLAGDQDWARTDTEALAGVLADVGAEVQLEIVPGDHQGPTWQASLPILLDFLLPIAN